MGWGWSVGFCMTCSTYHAAGACYYNRYNPILPGTAATNTAGYIINIAQKCDQCGSTAIDHTEELCSVYRSINRIKQAWADDLGDD